MISKKIKVLPSDISNIIAQYLRPRVMTLLNSKYRDNYFRKFGISVNYDTVPEDCIKKSLLVYKYDITLCGSRYRPETKTEHFLAQRIVSIKDMKIWDLSEVLSIYPNLQYISGQITDITNNIKCMAKIRNDLILHINYRTSVDEYQKYGLTNLVKTGNMDKDIIHKIKNYVSSSWGHSLIGGETYPNVTQVFVVYDLDYLLRSKPLLPILKKIIIHTDITPEDVTRLYDYYPGVNIILSPSCYGNWSYKKYSIFSDSTLCFWSPRGDEIDKLVKYQKKNIESRNTQKNNKWLLYDKKGNIPSSVKTLFNIM